MQGLGELGRMTAMGRCLLGDMACPDFYEWNARVQLTTWYPTPPNASAVYARDRDYARKHWSPLIRDYYARRAQGLLHQALTDAVAGRPLNNVSVALAYAELAYAWTTSREPYPLTPTPGYVQVSASMRAKYTPIFAPTCEQS